MTAPTPEEFLASTEPDEDLDEEHVDPLESIAYSFRRLVYLTEAYDSWAGRVLTDLGPEHLGPGALGCDRRWRPRGDRCRRVRQDQGEPRARDRRPVTYTLHIASTFDDGHTSQWAYDHQPGTAKDAHDALAKRWQAAGYDFTRSGLTLTRSRVDPELGPYVDVITYIEESPA